MNYAPKTASLAEYIYRDIDKNTYLNEIYEALLYNYSLDLFALERPQRQVQIKDALRFADLLSKSTYPPTAERDHQWGQEIATLLHLVYPQDEAVKYYLGSVLSAIGNYRGLKVPTIDGYKSADILDGIFYEFDKGMHLIPGKKEEYFFHDQKNVYDRLSDPYFSYSGPTSMGKSFVVQTYIKEQIGKGITKNFAILVPTKALINEVRSSMFDSLQNELKDKNYRIVSAIGEIYLQQPHNFIFIMTPERMHHLLIEHCDLQIDFVFIDEAHKISERGGRSSYKQHYPALVRDLVKGDIEMSACHAEAPDKDFDALRKFALIIMNDYASGRATPLTEMFDGYVTPAQKTAIMNNFPPEKTNDDITLSYDQAYTLSEAVRLGAKYPELKGENDEVDFNELLRFLGMLSRVFKWDVYEKETIGKSPGVLKWYAVILLRWIRGNGLNSIINHAIDYKDANPDTGVWVGNLQIAKRYDGSRDHKNYIIAETLGVIENVLLFSISNYFRKFSLEYKAFHNVEHFDNDWYEYVEYGTTNALTIFLQRVGFTRDSATFLEQPRNRAKYIEMIDGEIRVKKSALTCGNASVEIDANEIQFNMHELFVD